MAWIASYAGGVFLRLLSRKGRSLPEPYHGRLELTWTNKDWCLLADEEGAYEWVRPSDYRVAEVRLLREAAAVGEGSENLLIRGDALNALSALREIPAYADCVVGKVKLAYLDPPFNTQQSFLQFDDALEHSVWLTMMRDRLLQIRTLLAPGGSVWVHCDDYEQGHLRVLLDELFGRSNFVATVVWERQYTQSNMAVFSTSHDYILIYAHDRAHFANTRNRLPRSAKQDHAYKNPDNDPRGPWKPTPLQARNPYSRGLYSITTPSGRTIPGPPPGRYWSVSEEKFLELQADNRIAWGRDGSGVPAIKTFLSEVGAIVPKTWWPHTEAGHTDEAKRESKALSPSGIPFATPKPERLMQRIVEIATNPGDVVLDCFLGSGTTAAVAHKMGRRWIGIERSHDTLDTFAIPRLTKVVAGEDPGGITPDRDWQGGGGFRILDVGPSMFENDEGVVVLADWASNSALGEATAAQLGYRYELAAPFCGLKGRSRLAVIDGLVSPAVIELLVGALNENEQLTVCGTSVDADADATLRALRPGSRVRKIPATLMTEYQDATRWRPRLVRPDETSADGGRAEAPPYDSADAV